MTFGPKSSGEHARVGGRLGASPKPVERMPLVPKLPPGRASRKALAYAADIHTLRAAGYSFEAIRLALLDAGVVVSRTTVKREAAKRPAVVRVVPVASVAPIAPIARQPAAPASPPPSGARDVAIEPASFVGDARSGREIAEAFMKGRNVNPLLNGRTEDESRCD